MLRESGTCSGLLGSARCPCRAGVLAGMICVLAAAASPARSEEGTPAGTQPQIAAVAPAPEPAAAVVDPAVVETVKRPDARSDPSSDQQRRMLMLLLMNSAGPVRPFGNLGR